MKFEKKEARDLIEEYFSSAAASSDDDDDDQRFFKEKVQKLVGKVSEKYGYQQLVEGEKHQPAAVPENVFPKSEVLQKPPPLMLNIPSYRKPLIAAADPNPGETRFLKKVYSKWPRRQKTLAPEPAVDLSSYKSSSGNAKNGAGVWYVIGGKDIDPEHKGKIISGVAKKEGDGDEENNNNNKKNSEQEEDAKSKKNVQGKIINDDENEEPNFGKPTSAVTTTTTRKTDFLVEENDRIFIMIETILVLISAIVVLALGYRFRKYHGGK